MTNIPPTPLWAIVPIKSFSQGKSRLSGIACGTEREAFNSHCAHLVLDTLRKSKGIDEILIATNDDSIASWVSQKSWRCIRDGAGASLNEILTHALDVAEAEGAASAIILVCDLPFLDTESVKKLVDALGAHSSVLAPDRRGEGTNALGMRFSNRVSLHFEEDESYRRHREACGTNMGSVQVIESFQLGFDVDLPLDFEEFKSLETWPSQALKNVS